MCTWRDDANIAGGRASIHWVTKGEHRGLTDFYAGRQQYELFEPLEPLGGNPTLAYGSYNGRDTGFCQVLVGATDELAFQVGIGQSRDKIGTVDPCQVARRVGGMMLETMRGGS
ncbi:hypothetical protein GCM10027521_30900 [Amycolatopsis cihanbeyliensis]